MPSYTIEGVWSGYTSAQSRVVHREHTRSKKRALALQDLGRIRFDDGTALVFRLLSGKSGSAINGYGDLIKDCLAKKVDSVAALYASDDV